MKRDPIFEKYIDGVTTFESGLVDSSRYLLEDTLTLAKEYQLETGKYHFCYIGILEKLSKIYIHCKLEEKALLVLNIAKELEPNNLRILYRLFMFHLNTLPNEKLALKVYIEASNIFKNKGMYDVNSELFKNFSIKGENIKRKRETDLIVDQNLENRRIKLQNLMKQLPIEILAEIIKKLDKKSYKNLLMVCKHWRFTILSSPFLISIFYFDKKLTYNLLESYLTLFDKKISISEITVKQLSIDLNKSSQEFKTFKLLLSSQLKTEILNYTISNAFQTQLVKMIKESKSDLFKKLQILRLNITPNYSSLIVLPSFLRFTTNLKILILEIQDLRRNEKNIHNIFKNTINLQRLKEIKIYCDYNYFISKTNLLKFIKVPNLKEVTISGFRFSLINHFLTYSNDLYYLKIINYPVKDFIYEIDEYFSNIEDKLNSIETLVFSKNFSSLKNYIIAQDMITTNFFKNLKEIKFEMSPLTNEELNYFIDCSKNTLENLYISGETNLYYDKIDDNNNSRDFFSLKYLLENIPNIKRIKLNDNRITNSFFAFLMLEVATMNKSFHLEYLEISGNNLTPESYSILILSIKEKLFIDHLKLYGKADETFNILFKDENVKNQIKEIEFFIED